MPEPLCDCHGEPMRWYKDVHLKDGGKWRCPTTQRAHRRAWWAENREKMRVYREENSDTRCAVARSYYHERMSFEMRVRKQLRARANNSRTVLALAKQRNDEARGNLSGPLQRER